MKKFPCLLFPIIFFICIGATYNWQNAPIEKDEPILKFVHITDSHCISSIPKKRKESFSRTLQLGPYRFHWKDTQFSFSIFEKTIEFINENINADFLIHTGDITENGALTDLETVKGILKKLKFPYYTVMGDHDGIKSQNYLTTFQKRSYSFDCKNWHFVILSIFPDEQELKWFENDVSENCSKPIIFATHRLVVSDKFTVFLARVFYQNSHLFMPEAERVKNILKNFSNIKIVLSGHCHSNFHWEKDNIHFISTSALVEPPHQFRLFEIYNDKIIMKTFIAETRKKVFEKQWRIFQEEIIRDIHF